MVCSIIQYSPSRRGPNHVLLHPWRPRWAVANKTGSIVASGFVSGQSAEEIARNLSRLYDISLECAIRDVSRAGEMFKQSEFLDTEAASFLKRKPELRSLYLHLTQRCNLSCLHCYVGKPSSRRPLDLPVDLVFDLLDQMKTCGGQVVTFSGGEALLHPHIRAIMTRARPELEIQLLTNGTLMDRERAALLAESEARVQVSIDGSKPSVHDRIRGQGSFEKAVRALELLKEAGLGDRISTATTVMRQNIEDLPEIIGLAERLSVPMARFMPLRRQGTAANQWKNLTNGLSKKDIERFYDSTIPMKSSRSFSAEITCGLDGFLLHMPKDSSDDVWCPVGHMLAVDVGGAAYPCSSLMTPEFLLGNVFHQSMGDLFSGNPMKNVCEALSERRLKIERCSQCLWRNFCQGGCMALAFDGKGTIWDTDDFCDYRQKLYREAFGRLLSFSARPLCENG